MKVTYIVWAALLVIAAMVVVPVAADATNGDDHAPYLVNTSVAISPGGGNAPVVKCKFERELGINNWESGDPTHAIPGTQILPNCSYQGFKKIRYYAVVTDAESNGNVKLVFAKVYHPDGSYKYEVNFAKLSKTAGLTAFNDAVTRGLITYDPAFDEAEVRYELEKETAAVWAGDEDIHTCQDCGLYRVDVRAIDPSDNPSAILTNYFEFVCTPCCEFDFCNVTYGPVTICQNKWVAGDTIFGTKNYPTVRNIGNTDIKICLQQDDMGFGQDSNGVWEVEFDARLGNNGAEPTYDPLELVCLPDILPQCQVEELDFSIHVKKGIAGELHEGTMILGCQCAELPG
jgi:hypothetical protein